MLVLNNTGYNILYNRKSISLNNNGIILNDPIHQVQQDNLLFVVDHDKLAKLQLYVFIIDDVLCQCSTVLFEVHTFDNIEDLYVYPDNTNTDTYNVYLLVEKQPNKLEVYHMMFDKINKTMEQVSKIPFYKRKYNKRSNRFGTI